MKRRPIKDLAISKICAYAAALIYLAAFNGMFFSWFVGFILFVIAFILFIVSVVYDIKFIVKVMKAQ